MVTLSFFNNYNKMYHSNRNYANFVLLYIFPKQMRKVKKIFKGGNTIKHLNEEQDDVKCCHIIKKIYY